MDESSPDKPRSAPMDIIKPCRVQVIDVLKQTSFPAVLCHGASESHNTGSTSMDQPSSSTDSITILDDRWVKDEPASPSESDFEQPDLLEEESLWEGDDDFHPDSDGIDEQDGEDSEEDWIPCDDEDLSSSSRVAEGDTLPTQAPQSNENTSTKMLIDDVYLNQPLDNDTLVRIMETVYKVKTPAADTLNLLREQMEERPKLKVKLLKDLELGNSMFQKGGRRTFSCRRRPRRRRVKKQICGENDAEEGNRVPHSAITTNAPIERPQIFQGDKNLLQPVQLMNLQPQMPITNVISRHAPTKWTPHEPLTLATATAHVARSSGEQAYLHRFRTILPKNSAQSASVSSENTPTSRNGPQHNKGENCTAPTATVPPNPAQQSFTKGEQSCQQSTTKNIKFLDPQPQENHATFLPKSRTIKIPKLDAPPPGSIDVLVPVDTSGHMKPPFMAIPMNTCNLVFSLDGNEECKKRAETNQCDDMPQSSSSQASNQPIRNRQNSDAQIANKPQNDMGQNKNPVPHQETNAHPTIPNPTLTTGPSVQQPMQQVPGMLPTLRPIAVNPQVPVVTPQVRVPSGAPTGHYGLIPTGIFPSGVPGIYPPGIIPANLLPTVIRPNSMASVMPVQRPLNLGPQVSLPPTRTGTPVQPHTLTCPPGNEPSSARLQVKQERNTTPDLSSGVQSPLGKCADSPQKSSEANLAGIRISNVCSAAPQGTSSNNSDNNERRAPIVTGSSGNALANDARAQYERTASASEEAQQNPIDERQAKKMPPGGGKYPGSLVTVILPESARNYYQPSKDLARDIKEVTKPVTKVELGLLWNEIGMLRTEMQYMKTNIASEMEELKVEIGDFMREVREKISSRDSMRNESTKRKAHSSELCEINKRAKSTSIL